MTKLVRFLSATSNQSKTLIEFSYVGLILNNKKEGNSNGEHRNATIKYVSRQRKQPDQFGNP